MILKKLDSCVDFNNIVKIIANQKLKSIFYDSKKDIKDFKNFIFFVTPPLAIPHTTGQKRDNRVRYPAYLFRSRFYFIKKMQDQDEESCHSFSINKNTFFENEKCINFVIQFLKNTNLNSTNTY
jgi:hypothetical protein